MYPGIDGLASVPSIFEYAGEDGEKPGGQSLRHLATETLEGGMVWFHYRVERHPSSERVEGRVPGHDCVEDDAS